MMSRHGSWAGLLGLWLTGNTLNIYSQIGIVMLIGIAAKNGVLIVEFINQLRDAGRDFEAAITEAAGIRLRPVIMTTIATEMGSIPLMLATGAGSAGRNMLGIVIFSGSLYLLVFTRTSWLGAITPLGGVAFLAGWLLLALAAWRAQP